MNRSCVVESMTLIPPQQKALEETKKIFPTLRQNIKDALATLEEELVRDSPIIILSDCWLRRSQSPRNRARGQEGNQPRKKSPKLLKPLLGQRRSSARQLESTRNRTTITPVVAQPVLPGLHSNSRYTHDFLAWFRS